MTDAKTMKAELDDPFILIAEKKISSCAALECRVARAWVESPMSRCSDACREVAGCTW